MRSDFGISSGVSRSRSRVIALLALLLAAVAAADRGVTEPVLPDEVRASLGETEGRALKKADDIFFGRDKAAQKARYRLASPAYKAFCDEFPQVHQAAICYAIYQEGRAYQLDNKRTDQGRYMTYWRASSKQCLVVNSRNGYIYSIESVSPRTCRD